MIRKNLVTEDAFEFEAGGRLERLNIVYHISKEQYSKGDKVIVICHALTANSDAEDWWPQLVGPGKLFDTQRYFILCVNMICSPYGTSGPSSLKEDGTPFFFDFPKTTVRDMVRASILVRKHLGVGHIDLMVGSSIGGFQAFEWAIMEPDIIGNVAFMATAPRVSPWLSSTQEAQRLALEADSTFRQCASPDGGKEGLRSARAQALISYRGFDGFQITQSENDPDIIFAGRAASYERHQGDKFVGRFDAYSYYYLTFAIDSHNVGRQRGGVEKALGTIKANAIVVAIDSDILFPVKEIKEWAKFIPNSQYHEITSQFAHDGFLLEWQQITKLIEPLL